MEDDVYVSWISMYGCLHWRQGHLAFLHKATSLCCGSCIPSREEQQPNQFQEDYIQGFEKSQFNISVLYNCIYCYKQSVLKFAWLVLATEFSSLASRWHCHYFVKGPFLKCFLAINYISKMWKHIYLPRADSALARSKVINSAFHEICGLLCECISYC